MVVDHNVCGTICSCKLQTFTFAVVDHADRYKSWKMRSVRNAARRLQSSLSNTLSIPSPSSLREPFGEEVAKLTDSVGPCSKARNILITPSLWLDEHTATLRERLPRAPPTPRPVLLIKSPTVRSVLLIKSSVGPSQALF